MAGVVKQPAQTKDPVRDLLEVAKQLRPGPTQAVLWYQLQAAIAKVDRLYSTQRDLTRSDQS